MIKYETLDQAQAAGGRPAAVRRRAWVGHERQGGIEAQPDALGECAEHQGDVLESVGLAVPVFGVGLALACLLMDSRACRVLRSSLGSWVWTALACRTTRDLPSERETHRCLCHRWIGGIRSWGEASFCVLADGLTCVWGFELTIGVLGERTAFA